MENLTSKIKTILDTLDEKVDVDAAALVLLQVNRNRILHQNLIRSRNVAKLKYELQKIYNFRVQDEAIAETKKLEAAAAVVVKETFLREEKKEQEELQGKRPDHGSLPDEIKAKFLENQNIYPQMRKLHEQLKLLNNAKACDRYEFLKELVALDKKLRENWDAYDAYVIPVAPPVVPPSASPATPPAALPATPPAAPSQDSPAAPTSKEINAARKYISDNKAKLAELKAGDDQAKYEALLAKVQTRLDLIIKSNAGISEEQLNELIVLGCHA
ncbi:MAG: hypothetical protein LBQ39_06975 [Tannerellaceae bacterium]|jgi:hypothetical protein|nr:hypothetical protein [Tannerellaceae bacterium]